jgi:UPF0755 protein
MQKTLKIAANLSAILFVFVVWNIYDFVSGNSLEEPVTIVFPPNTHFTDIVDMIAEKNIIRHPLTFKIALFGSGQSSKIKAGEYAFPPHMSPKDVAALLISGKTVVHHFTVAEGLMTVEILDMVKNSDLLTGEITLDVKEGELLPETYNFSRGDKRNDILLRMRHAMEKTIAECWEGRGDGLPFADPQQAVTLASIVEKETSLKTERARVAAVYINRLRKHMLLQADPTTAYAVTGGKIKLNRALTLKDLTIKSPYNTYVSPGLPPGPIANPGKASLIASLHPLNTNELYFVATGNGGHNFAATMKEHEVNVKKYRENKQ